MGRRLTLRFVVALPAFALLGGCSSGTETNTFPFAGSSVPAATCAFANAPPNVVEAEREKLERYRRELDALSN